jgi:hypothetical protein
MSTLTLEGCVGLSMGLAEWPSRLMIDSGGTTGCDGGSTLSKPAADRKRRSGSPAD